MFRNWRDPQSLKEGCSQALNLDTQNSRHAMAWVRTIPATTVRMQRVQARFRRWAAI